MSTLRVRNVAQKVLWEQELSGQISDGQWENATPHNHWEPWCGADVVIDPDNVGRDFYARRETYNFTAKDLLDVVGERMIAYVRKLTGNAEYSEADLRADLKDLKAIIKVTSQRAPVPPQPSTWQVALSIDGYPQLYTTYVPVSSETEALEVLARREREGQEYRLRRVEKEIAEAQAKVDKLELDAKVLRAQLGMLV